MTNEWTKKHDKTVGEKANWKLGRTRYLYQSKFHNLRQDEVTLPNGEETTFTYMEHPGAVFAVPVTPDGKIILIHTYRYTIDSWVWELPAGGLGDKVDRDPAEVVLEELREEIGGTAKELQDLGWFYSSKGVANKKVRYFIAYGVQTTEKTAHEASETIDQIRAFTITEVKTMIENRQLVDGDSILHLLMAFPHLEKRSFR